MASLLKDYSYNKGEGVWSGKEYKSNPTNFHIVSASDGRFPGESYGRYTILGTDGSGPNTTSGQRAEHADGGIGSPLFVDGEVAYLGYSFRFPTNYPLPGPGSSTSPTAQGGSTGGSGHSISFQWHTNDTASPKVALNLRNDLFSLTYDFSIPTSDGGWRKIDGSIGRPVAHSVFGDWGDMVWWTKFGSSGFNAVWLRPPGDTKYYNIMPQQTMATSSSGGVYLKIGVYTGNLTETKTRTVDYSNVKTAIANSRTDATFSQAAWDLVAPALPSGGGGGTPPPTVTTNVEKIMVFVEENHSLAEMTAGMPYLASLGTTYGKCSNYTAMTHPSLPNYLAMAFGKFNGISDDNPPSSHPMSGNTIFDQAIGMGKTAKTYCESMPSNNRKTDSSPYAVKHNPWAYATDATPLANANSFDVPLGTTSSGALKSDIANGTIPNVSMIIPNLNNDAHDGTLATADNWLGSWLPLIFATDDFKTGKLAVVITGDEDDSSQGNKVLTVVCHAAVSAKSVSTALNHYSLTKACCDVVGAGYIANASTAADMLAAFGLSAAGGGGTPPPPPPPSTSAPLSSLVDPFDGTSVDSTIWPTKNGTPTVANSVVSFQPTGGATLQSIRSAEIYNAVNDSITIGPLSFATVTGAGVYDPFRVQLYRSQSVGDFMTVKRTVDTANSLDQLIVVSDIANAVDTGVTGTNPFSVDFDAANMVYWRISNFAGNGKALKVETSPDGSTWTTRVTHTETWAFTASDLAQVEAGARIVSGTPVFSTATTLGGVGVAATPPPAPSTGTLKLPSGLTTSSLIVGQVAIDNPTAYISNESQLPFSDWSSSDPTTAGVVAGSKVKQWALYKAADTTNDTADWSIKFSDVTNWSAESFRIDGADVFASDNGVASVATTTVDTPASSFSVTLTSPVDNAYAIVLAAADEDAVTGAWDTAPPGWTKLYGTSSGQPGGISTAAYGRLVPTAGTTISSSFAHNAAGGVSAQFTTFWIRPAPTTAQSSIPAYEPGPTDCGYVAWTQSVLPVISTSSPSTGGTVRLVKFPIPQDITFSKICIAIGTAATNGAASQANTFLGVYRVSGDTATLVAKTADQSTAWQTAQTLAATATAQPGESLTLKGGPGVFGYLAFLEGTQATTKAAILRGTTMPGAANGTLTAAQGYVLGTSGSSLTALPSTVSLSGMSAGQNAYWLALA